MKIVKTEVELNQNYYNKKITTYEDGSVIVEEYMEGGRTRKPYKLTEKEIAARKLEAIAKEIWTSENSEQCRALASEIMKISRALLVGTSVADAFSDRIDTIEIDWLWEDNDRNFVVQKLKEIQAQF